MVAVDLRATVQFWWPGLLVARVRERGIASAQEAVFSVARRPTATPDLKLYPS
jgi:hypothetical protein